jgi:uncharacterized membrane protein YpjA
MFIEALFFFRFFHVWCIGLGVAALWIFSNDYIDYHYAVFPGLPNALINLVDSIRNATIGLSILTCVIFCGLYVALFKQRE